jgi:hypothetical protein
MMYRFCMSCVAVVVGDWVAWVELWGEDAADEEAEGSRDPLWEEWEEGAWVMGL